MRPGRGGGWSDRMADEGSASVELAAALPALVLVVALLVGALAWARDGVIVAHAAGAAVRSALVESEPAAVEAAREVAGEAAQVEVVEADGRVTVTVSLERAAWLPAASASVTGTVP